jgi:hypothetical protein
MSQNQNDGKTKGVQTAPMPKPPNKITRAALAELIKRTNQSPVKITAQT